MENRNMFLIGLKTIYHVHITPPITRRKLVHYNHLLQLGHCNSWREKCINKSFRLWTRGFWLIIVQNCSQKPSVNNHNDFYMHFLVMSRSGKVATVVNWKFLAADFGHWVTKSPRSPNQNDLFMHFLAMNYNGRVATDSCHGQSLLLVYCIRTRVYSNVWPIFYVGTWVWDLWTSRGGSFHANAIL